MDENQGSRSSGHSTLYIVGAIVLAIVFSVAGPLVLGERIRPLVGVLDLGGEIFLRLLQMVAQLMLAQSLLVLVLLWDLRR